MIHPAPIVNRANGIFELAAGGEHMTPPRPLTTTWRIATDRDGRFRHSPDGTPATIGSAIASRGGPKPPSAGGFAMARPSCSAPKRSPSLDTKARG